MNGPRPDPAEDGGESVRSGDLEILRRAARHRDRVAVSDARRALRYGELLAESAAMAAAIRVRLGLESDLAGARIAFLVSPSVDYVVLQWAIWRAGGIAVPLCISHPAPELEHVLRDCGASLLVHSLDRRELAREAGKASDVAVLSVDELRVDELRVDELPVHELAGDELPQILSSRRAMILYTSGTTGRPKGVVSTHSNLSAQMEALVSAWAWSERDRILHVLPLHHLHGIVNVLGCALWSGARCELMDGFDAEAVWERLASGEITLFMAVPTIYSKLLAAHRGADGATSERWSRAASQLRLMVSGSAALPARVLEEWHTITGHVLLERYGMTETGMILSNPLAGERVPGAVGSPLPGMEVRFRDGGEESENGRVGELEVRGAAVFSEYWRRPEETRASFADGWFRTGDVAELAGGRYRMLGRTSVDIVKTGGYKVSALEIEEVLRTHPAIRECAVVGVPDEEWGQRVAAAVVPAAEGAASELELEALRAWGKERLAPYKVPTRLKVVDQLPRNAMGKVTKPDVVELFA